MPTLKKTENWGNEATRGMVTACLMLVALLCIGTAGYRIIEEWNYLDAFYMSVITISTVGYGETQPLSDAGRIFSAGFILLGVCVVAYSINIIGRTILEGELNKLRGKRKMLKEIKTMQDHFIICGYGRLTRHVISDLVKHGHPVVVIESDPMRMIEMEAEQIPYLEGNAYEDEVLEVAGVGRAKALLTLLPGDADNVYVVLSARNINPKLHIVARTESAAGEGKLRLAGANYIISPYRVSGARAVQHLIHPKVNDFLEIATDSSGESLLVEQITISSSSSLDGQTLSESGLRDKTGVIVAACIEPDGQMSISPGRDNVLRSGATLIALGTRDHINKLVELA